MYVCAIFPKEEKGAVNKVELFLLWAFVTGYKGINMAKWLVDGFEEQISSPRGDIHLGGIITLIAHRLKINIPSKGPEVWEMVEGSVSIDLPNLKHIGMISELRGGGYVMNVGGRGNKIPYINLPNPNLPVVAVHQPETWFFQKVLGQIGNQEEDQEMSGEEEENRQHSQVPPNQFPPEFFTQFQEEVRGSLANIQGSMANMEGRINSIYNYGATH